MIYNSENKYNPMSTLDIYDENRGNEKIKEIEMRYSMENDMIRAVSQGNYRALRDMLTAEIFMGNIEARTQDRMRNLKNYMIIFNTLLRKGAEVGNVHPYYIHGISSKFASMIETCAVEKDIESLWNEMSYSYCKLVEEHKSKGYSPLVQNIIMLIDANISESLTLSSMAEKFNVNASYLSSLFKKDTGITYTEVVNSKRIERGKYLLRTTKLQIQDVSVLCGIPDTNYFIKVFKKHTDLTPKQYRDQINSKT